MQSTKEQILADIMKAGPSTAANTSRDFSLVRMTIRQNLLSQGAGSARFVVRQQELPVTTAKGTA